MTNSNTFIPGQIVSLKSGGPTMTVEKCTEMTVTCVWFNDKKEWCKTEFAIYMLKAGAP